MDDGSCLAAILEHNKRFVADNKGLSYQADRRPRKHLAVVSCMDARLITLLTAALGLENGDANVIKVAGAEVNDPYGTVMYSLLVAVYELDIQDIMVIAHTDCGVQQMSCSGMCTLMKNAGITDEVLKATSADGVDLDQWLEGFGDLEASVKRSVSLIQSHPLMPSSIRVHGFVIDTQTGELTAV